jgi:hypothetical protein
MGDDARPGGTAGVVGRYVFRIRGRLYIGRGLLVVGLVILALGIGMIVASGSQAASEGRPVVPVFGGLLAWLGWRMALASVIADGQGVTIHNFSRSLSFPWAEVVEFRSSHGQPCLIAANRSSPVKVFGLSPLRFSPGWKSKELVSELNALAATHHDAATAARR